MADLALAQRKAADKSGFPPFLWTGRGRPQDVVFGAEVRVVIDRFHVMKNFQERLEKARRDIQKTLHPEPAKRLKGLPWLWITHPSREPGRRSAAGVAETKNGSPGVQRTRSLF